MYSEEFFMMDEVDKEMKKVKKGQTIRINDDVVHSVNRVNWGERKTLIHWWQVV